MSRHKSAEAHFLCSRPSFFRIRTSVPPCSKETSSMASFIKWMPCVPQGGFGASYAPYPSFVSRQVRKDRQGSDKEFQLCKSRFELWGRRNHSLFLERSGPSWLCSRRLPCYSRVVEIQTLLLLHHPPRWKLPLWSKETSQSTENGWPHWMDMSALKSNLR